MEKQDEELVKKARPSIYIKFGTWADEYPVLNPHEFLTKYY